MAASFPPEVAILRSRAGGTHFRRAAIQIRARREDRKTIPQLRNRIAKGHERGLNDRIKSQIEWDCGTTRDRSLASDR